MSGKKGNVAKMIVKCQGILHFSQMKLEYFGPDVSSLLNS